MTRLCALQVAFGVGLSTVAGSSTRAAQELARDREIRIEVGDPRPMSAAVREVERLFGVVVTYEDGSYVAPDDIVDVTERVRRDGSMSERVHVMRGGRFRFVHTPAPTAVRNQVEDVLDALVARWNRSGGSGQFTVLHVEGGHHVLPHARRGVAADIEPYRSPLDVDVQLSYQERDGFETLVELSKAVSEASGRDVMVGTVPNNSLRRRLVAMSADNENARGVLWRTLQAIDTSLSWQLLCGVGEQASCAINVHAGRAQP